MSAEQTILVVGATGLLGQPVARHLREDGFQVRVMGRDKARTKRIFDGSFEVVVGDVTDADTLEENLDGCFGVHISLAEGSLEAEGVRNITAVSARKGVERIGYVSGTTVCEANAWFSLVEEKLAAERAVRESGIPFIIFRPSWFMEMLANFIHGKVAICIGKHSAPYHFLATDDFGAMAARAYGLDEAPNEALQLHGPEALRLRDAIDRYRSVLHPEIAKVTQMPYWLAKVVGFLRGRKGQRMRQAIAFLKYFETVGEGPMTPETERFLGQPTTRFDDWLEARRQELGDAA